MARFLKGTTDHDRDGKMGGSMKENDMTTTKKPVAKKASAHTPQTGMEPGPDAKAAKKAAKEQFAEADAKIALDPEAQALADLQVQRSVRGW
jgi:hypothetical protein